MLSNKNFIYFDNNSTTRTDDRVVEVILPFFSSNYANPSSKHSTGQEAKIAVENSRKQISEIINAEPQEIIFTSGATEAINLSIKGIAETYSSKGKHIITTQTEHSAVIDVCRYLEKRGFEIDFLPVDKYGLINATEFETKVRKDTILVSVIYVNNETGVIQPIEVIGEICKRNDIFFFTDATQAIGKIPIDVNKLNIDLMCFSGHKFYGQKGVGGLYCRKNVKLEALFHGGGQERGLRSGTLNVPGIVGLAKSFEIATGEMEINQEKIKLLRDKFEKRLLETNLVNLNGHSSKRLFNVSNLCFTETDPILLTSELKNVAFSQGSACNSSSIKPSHVLKAMGLTDKEILSSFRFSFGKYNTMEEINQVISTINKLFESDKISYKV